MLAVQCEPGYKSNSGLSECQLCPSKRLGVALTTVLSILVVIAIILVYWLVIRGDRHLIRYLKRVEKRTVEWSGFAPLFARRLLTALGLAAM